MSQLTQPFSSRDTILALITPPLVPAPPPPAGAERLVAKRGAYTGVPFYAAVSATLGLQRLLRPCARFRHALRRSAMVLQSIRAAPMRACRGRSGRPRRWTLPR